MIRAFTLIEMLLAMFIISLSLLWALPKWQGAEEKMLLNQESEQLYLFLRQIQARAENSSQIWLIVGNQNANQWCISAQLKTDQICNCLNPNSCPNSLSPYFYQPYFVNKVKLHTNQLYPTEITHFNGVRNTFESSCLALQAGDERKTFLFSNVGRLRIITGKNSSACS